MKQVVQSLRDGKVRVATVPDPAVERGHVLIANTASLLSAGTEKMVLELGRKSLLGKARERPDQVRRLFEKLRQEGLLSTLRQAFDRLDEPQPMGYSSCGRVLATGDGVQGLRPGDRVASNGPHAGVVSVPKNLCARVPEGVEDEHAAFATVGAIALQGVRLARLGLGETALVVGLGLVGQLAVALLQAAGCRVLGTDPDARRCELALALGAGTARPGLTARDVAASTGGHGADAVLIAAATRSREPMDLAAEAVRQKGRVVLVGVVDLHLDRRPFYFKEAELVVSCSYGPGRYDPSYEERGHDYPYGYVRWSEQRNLSAVLDLMARGRLDVSPLVSHRFPIDEAGRAYELIDRAEEPYLGIVLTYPALEPRELRRRLPVSAPRAEGPIGVGVVGAGSFARSVLLPAIRAEKRLRGVVLASARGLTAEQLGTKHGFEAVASDVGEVFADESVRAVFLVTRHDSHAALAVAALAAGKDVFVEKPLCLTLDELAAVEEAVTESSRLLMVGFNRRFSPAVERVKDFFADVEGPLTLSIRFNAGDVPAGHWTQDGRIGGGRLIGEACHGVDLAAFLAGSPPVRVHAESVGGGAGEVTDDRSFITLRHADGSVSSVAYLAGGDRAFAKERVEVIGGGRVATIDDFRAVTLVRDGRSRTWRGRQDKGHRREVAAFARALAEGTPAPIAWDEIRAVTAATLLAVRSLRSGEPQDVT